MGRYALPLIAFVALFALLAVGLSRDPREVPSPLIDKPVPGFSLPRLHQPQTEFTPEQMADKVWLLNIWASWCTACRAEHPLLMALSDKVNLVGLNYKDSRHEALAWLEEHGDPYRVTAVDLDGSVGIDWGVYGVPETFVIDRRGRIRYKQIGPVTPEALKETILPLVKLLEAES